jgi:hypothetical protein
MPPADEYDRSPQWDQSEADWLIGKYALVGITYLEPDGKTLKSKAQYHGRIVSADKDKGFAIECAGKWAGSMMGLPPVLSAFRPAKPGEYKLHATGEVVTDPDVLATWTITEPVRS